MSSQCSLDPTGRLFTEQVEGVVGAPRPIVLCAAAASGEGRRRLARVADIVECGEEQVDLARALDELAARGLRRVLCEGGPTLHNGLMVAGLLDELCLSQAMLLAGPGHKTLSQGTALPDVARLRLGHLLVGDSVMLGRWEIAR